VQRLTGIRLDDELDRPAVGGPDTQVDTAIRGKLGPDRKSSLRAGHRPTYGGLIPPLVT
jgi:hypothetical protein